MKLIIEVTPEEFAKNQYRLEDFGYQVIKKAYEQILKNQRGSCLGAYKAVAEIVVK